MIKPLWLGLKAKNVPVTISIEYLDYTNIFFLDFMVEVFKHTDINKDSINLTIAFNCVFKATIT